jgi:3-deoxy-7-phosphoheptulonate synthase
MWDTAVAVKDSGATMLRGGTFKPRTSPYSFQGLGEEGLKILKDVGMRLDMPVVSEILSPEQLEMFKHIGVDMVQIGARNAQNYALISEVAKSGIPMLLKRGPGSTIEEWLGAAEYALLAGNGNVILCERGIRTFSNHMRYELDTPGMIVAKGMTHLPIGADPSHAAGKTEYVSPLALSAAGVGAKFLLIEVHCNPKEALSDAEQQLTPKQFGDLMENLRR